MTWSPTLTYFDLLDVFKGTGCPACQLALASVARYIESVNYESVGDPGLREHLRASLGFCNEHAEQWLHTAHVLGTAQIYVDVLTWLTREMEALPFHQEGILASASALLTGRARPRQNETLQDDVLAPTRPCPACSVLAETEEMAVDTLLGALGEPDFRSAYVASPGLCVPHTRLALARVTDQAAFRTLRDAVVARQQLLLAHLREIIRKHDYRFRNEPSGEEKGAAERAVHHVVGAYGIGR